jgi:hypothetical protein
MANTLVVSDRRNTRASTRCAVATAAALAVTVAIVGCGSGSTTTVSVPRSTGQPAAGATGAASSPAAKSPSPTGSASSTSTGSTSAATPSAPQRTASSPAFARQEGSSEGLDSALAVLRGHGFVAGDPSEYHSAQTLRVLIGTRGGPGAGRAEQAFFFEDGRYLGTDTSQPSSSMAVVSQSDTEVTLAYTLYRPHDPPCCPGGGRASVRFALDNGSLQALDPIPPVSSTSTTSRQ